MNETYVFPDESNTCIDTKEQNCFIPHLNPYESSFSSLQSASAFMSDRNNLQRFAIAVQETVACIQNENSKPYCQESAHDIDYEFEFVADFLASSENIDVLVNVSSSQCLSYPPLLQYLETDLYGCISDLFTDLQKPGEDPCHSLETMKECFIMESATWCGPEAGVFVETVYDALVHSDDGRKIIQESPLPSSVVDGCYQ